MSFQAAVITRATVIVWKNPEVGDLPPFLEMLRATRVRFRGEMAFISVSPPEIVPPSADFFGAVRPLMNEIFQLAPHAAVVIEGAGIQQAFARTFHSVLFTMTRRNVGVFKTMPDALARLAPALGLDLETWTCEVRVNRLLSSRMSHRDQPQARIG
jgi:hypothetical protein